MDDVMKVLVAYGILALGPPIGLYMYLKSANKIFAAAAGAFSKAGRTLGKFAGDGAQRRFERSQVGVGVNARRNGEHTSGIRDSAAELEKENSWARKLTTFRMSDKGKTVYGQMMSDISTDYRDKQLKAHNEVMSDTVANLMKDGYGLDETGQNWINAAGTKVSVASLDDGSKVATKYLHQNKLVGRKNADGSVGKHDSYAMRSAIMKLGEKGQLNIEAARAASKQIKNGDVSAYAEWLNSFAGTRGLTHLTYNSTVDENGETKFVAGGSKVSRDKRAGKSAAAIEAEGLASVAKSYVGKGTQTGNKYTNLDETFQGHVAAAIENRDINNDGIDSNTMWANLAKTEPELLWGLVKSLKTRSGRTDGKFDLDGKTFDDTSFSAELDAVRQKIGSAGP